jgi:hypothetical protein
LPEKSQANAQFPFDVILRFTKRPYEEFIVRYDREESKILNYLSSLLLDCVPPDHSH